MSKNIALTLACGDYESIRPLLEGRVKADGIDLTILTKMDSATRHWRFLRNGEFDAGRSLRLILPGGARQQLAVPRHSGVPASPLPARLHVHQHDQGHQQAGRSDRPQSRRQDADDHRGAVDARPARARIQRAAQIDRMVQRNQQRRRRIAAEGSQAHRAAGRQIGRNHAGRRRTRRRAAFRPDQAVPRQGPARRPAVSRSQERRKSPITARPASSRSCTCWA